MIGPARRWSYIGRNGAWRELALPNSAGAIAERPALDDLQFAALVSDSEIDEIIVLLQDRGPLPARRPSETYSIVQHARHAASLAGLDRDLWLDWCRYCLENLVYLNNPDGIAAALAWRAQQMQRSSVEEP